ncbi:hypothetical protein, partial [Mycolicibacterium sp.]|uniref:hypothetical protein n=1 Tax=Mycolicibacterium sp. TaxID=2320850 RepID=UPI003560B445
TVVTSVRSSTRAQQRAALVADDDGIVTETRALASPMRAALIGAGVAVVVLGGLGAVALALGWI